MKKIDIIGMPIKYGCFVDGADKSYEYLKDILESIFNTKSKCVDCNVFVDSNNVNNKLKYLNENIMSNKNLYKEITNSLANNCIPFTIGGDHSCVIGSVGAVLDYYKDVSVIYIDKHADIHTEATTPSGNIHGIPVAVSLGESKIYNISKNKLNPKNLYYIGLSNYEKEEMDYIKSHNIYYKKSNEIDNIDELIEDILKRINTKYVHISFDLDVIKPTLFNAVNVCMENIYQDEFGLTIDNVKEILFKLISRTNISSIDIVEYNPLIDEDFKCREIVKDILKEIKKGIDNNDFNK